MRRDTDTAEVDAMTAAVHLLICAPLGGDRSVHQGSDPADDVACRSRARFLVATLASDDWRLTQVEGGQGA